MSYSILTTSDCKSLSEYLPQLTQLMNNDCFIAITEKFEISDREVLELLFNHIDDMKLGYFFDQIESIIDLEFSINGSKEHNFKESLQSVYEAMFRPLYVELYRMRDIEYFKLKAEKEGSHE